jgi:hypothetical protein
MYKCKECGRGVIVAGVEVPIRGCDCTKEIEINGEKKRVPSTIVTDMSAVAEGKSQFKQK